MINVCVGIRVSNAALMKSFVRHSLLAVASTYRTISQQNNMGVSSRYSVYKLLNFKCIVAWHLKYIVLLYSQYEQEV